MKENEGAHPLVTSTTFAAALRVSPAILHRRVRHGQIPAPVTAHAHFYYWQADALLPWLRESGQDAVADRLVALLKEECSTNAS